MTETKFLSDLLAKKAEVEALLAQKVNTYNSISTQRDQLGTDIMETNGRLAMIKELVAEQEAPKNEEK